MTFTYQIELTAAELRSLAWIAGRYEGASILYHRMTPIAETEAGGLYEISETAARAAFDANEEEIGSAEFLPCAPAGLLSKWIKLLDSLI
jgi:hypothetical protein